MHKEHPDNVENMQDFVDQESNTKSVVQRCVKFLEKETNKNKFNYGQLRYIFRAVRERCDIQISEKRKSLYELPTSQELQAFYAVVGDPTHKLLFEFLQGTDLRISELCSLEVSRIDFDQNMIVSIQ